MFELYWCDEEWDSEETTGKAVACGGVVEEIIYKGDDPIEKELSKLFVQQYFPERLITICICDSN